MKGICAIFAVLAIAELPAFAATSRMGLQTTTTSRAAAQTASPTAAYNYNYMYPYLNNQMRTDLNPGVTPSQGSNPIDVITRTEKLGSPRRVVPRKANNNSSAARSASKTSVGSGVSSVGTARSGTQSGGNAMAARAATQTSTPARKVVARSARGDNSYLANTVRNAATQTTKNTTDTVSSARCLADYTECMNGYCQREKTAYNRCYCSARLAQIDAEYQPAIDSLIKQIIRIRSNNPWSDAEMNQYWMNTIGKYTGDNSWEKLDDALNINWADTESRVRGQQAFSTGHSYCVQHLRNCYYMASNLRDAYRSEISRDCSTYEAGLQRIKNAAENIVENYSD